MKKIILFFGAIIFGLSSGFVNAQGSWFSQTNPTSEAGESMQFVSETEGWVSLKNNALLHTTNGGVTWQVVIPNATDVTSGMDAQGGRLSFVNASTGWVIKTFGNNNSPLGAVLYKTTNGGSNWQRIVLSTTAGDAAIQVQFIDVNNGWALIYNMNTGIPTFLKTTNGGTTWLPTNGGGIFYYVSPTVGYAYAAGPSLSPPYTFYKTTDGGANWVPQYTDNTAGEIQDMKFTDANNGWAVGRNGKIFKTTNGGATWNASVYNATYDNHEVFFINNNIGWIASKQSGYNPIMLYTVNGGASWLEQTLPFTYNVFSMSFWDANHGWAASDYGGLARYLYDPAGTYTNATLNGPWFFYTSPLNPYNDNLNYMVFDGNGNIIDMNGFPAPASGSYHVNPDGTFYGNLIIDATSYPFSGLLTSQTSGTGTVAGVTWSFSKISNPGALKDKLTGTLSTDDCGSRSVELIVDANGIVTSATGLAGPVNGRVYTDMGVYLGHMTTGEAGSWHEFSIMGYYSNNILTGQLALDSNSCTNQLVNLVRSDNLGIEENNIGIKNIVLYPNPNNGSFRFDIKEPKGKLQIEIYNSFGQKVYNATNYDQKITNEIYFEPQAKGVYFIKIFDGKNLFKEKFLVK